MQSIIIKLFIMQADDGAKKTLSALAVLRQECINEAPEDYNSWLGSLKDIILEKGKYTFWDAIVQGIYSIFITKFLNVYHTNIVSPSHETSWQMLPRC